MPLQSTVPEIRIRTHHENELNPDGQYVLYWMISARRTHWNFGLQRAIDWAKELKRPLIVFEPLRCTYPWNSDRFHAFAIQGMADNARDLSRKNVTYYPYLEPSPGDEKGLLKALAKEACLIVSDDFPCFFLPHMTAAAVAQIPNQFEFVDSNGLYPMRDTDRAFSRAYDFRRHLQKNLRPHLLELPDENPFHRARLEKLDSIPKHILKRWPPADPQAIAADLSRLKKFPIDHRVGVAPFKGGAKSAEVTLKKFLDSKLDDYDQSRNQPEESRTSGLSPYLHWGHISAHQVFNSIADTTNWSPSQLAEKATGQNRGWWGLAEPVESFLDELITWRELGYNFCVNRDDYDQYESLPDWCRKTLADHADDQREYLYSLEEFETGQTHDPLWNAAQQQLVSTGIIHNYLRMLWGKKIVQWTSSPQEALKVMVELNNKWALDGRNPNSYSGIFWVLGRYDRAWGERPVFGKIRYMSSKNTARKVKVKKYLAQFADK